MANEVVESELPGIEFVGSPVVEEEKPQTERKRGRPKGSVSKASLDKLQEEIAESIVEASAAIAVASPLAMAVLDERADKTASAIITLAGGSPRLINALKKTVKARAVITIAETCSAVSVALMVDYNRMQPDSLMAQKFGVTGHYLIAYPPAENNGNGNGHVDIQTRSGLFE